MRRTPSWIVLSQLALEVTALALVARVILRPKRRWLPSEAAHRLETVFASHEPAVPSDLAISSDFITEVADKEARRYRFQTQTGTAFVGFYSDGRVRLITADDRKFSGVVVDHKAIMADLHADDSFEMEMSLDAKAQLHVMMNGGPFDGQTFALEAQGDTVNA